MKDPVSGWFRKRGWKPFEFQKEVWEAFEEGQSGLLHSRTGTGKTYAVWMAVLRSAIRREDPGGSLRVIWVTPLRALAADTLKALAEPVHDLLPEWTVDTRTGDTSGYRKRKIREKPPEALITTPESLTLLLTQPDFLHHFQGVDMIVVDEWHELLSTKRGVQLELALARLRTLSPGVRTWGLSATLGNTAEAARVLGGFESDGGERPMRLVHGTLPKRVVIKSLLPPADTKYPWGGHLGLKLLPKVVELLRANQASIVFTNTRSQAELWFRSLAEAMPDWSEQLGLHHGSLSRDSREETEDGLRSGRLRAVVATSSLDLGVDFSPVDAVLQVGSPKGVARLLQRAGRSGHQPGAVSTVYCVPANTFELLEIAAARDLADAAIIEDRTPLGTPLDVLCQHLATVAAGGMAPGTDGGFSEEALLREVRTTHAYHNLTLPEWEWALDFAARGGDALKAYPQFARMARRGEDYVLKDETTTRQHRMAVGTITSDASISVQFLKGRHLGSVEESFIARLKPGDRFLFAGKPLEFVRVRDLRAYVRLSRSGPRGVPRWMGGRLPLSTRLSAGVRARLDKARSGEFEVPEMKRLREILALQERLSHIPSSGEFLIERLQSREGHHLFFYPFEGRLVHEGLAALFAFRFSRLQPLTFSLAVNDYGFEMLSPKPIPLETALEAGFLATDHLLEDILGSINSSEMGRRKFREIARIAGLTHEGVGRSRKSARQLLISASLLYDVFRRYDPGNRLLGQATREVLETQLEHTRLLETLLALQGRSLIIRSLDSCSPFAYPLFVERFREQLSSEDLANRVRKMEIVMEKGVGKRHSSHGGN